MDHPEFKKFMKKHTGNEVPSASTIRTNIAPITAECIDKVRKTIGKDRIWVSLDETTDRSARNEAAFLVGSLEHPETGFFLINFEHLHSTTANDLVDFFIRSLRILFPRGKRHLCMTKY